MYNLCHRTKLYFLTIHISKKTVSNIDTNFKGGIFVTMKEKISIIVPIYNVERYLKRCLQSVWKQSYENWECILINDGSTKESE